MAAGGRPRQPTAAVRIDDETFEDLVLDAQVWGRSFNVEDGLGEVGDPDYLPRSAPIGD